MKPLLRKGKPGIFGSRAAAVRRPFRGWVEATRKAALTALALTLLACQTPHAPEAVVRTVEVRVPVPVACVPPETPQHQPARATLPATTGELIQALTGELILRRAYDDAIEPVIAACQLHTRR